MNWPHLHLVLNHIPVLGAVFGLALLSCAMWRRNDSLQRAALWTFVGAALVAIPTYLTGEPAEEVVEHLAGTSEAAIETHEKAAMLSLIAIELLGGLALAAIVLLRTRVSTPLLVRSTLAAALITAGLMTWTADRGGRIRHSELQQATIQHDDAEESGAGRGR